MADLKISQFVDGSAVQTTDEIATNRAGVNTKVFVGSAAALDVGTAIGDIVQLENIGGGTPGLPGTDGSQLTGVISSAVLVAASVDTTCWVGLFESATGNQAPKTSALITANANTGVITAGGFIGPLTGNASTATALQNARTIGGVSFDGTGNIVPQTIQVIDASADTTTFPMLAGSATGNLQPLTDPGLAYNASTNVLTVAGGVAGDITGNAATVTVAVEGADTSSFLGVFTAGSGNLQPKTVATIGVDTASIFLGIGTASPAARLHLAGNVSASAWTTNGIGLRIQAGTYTDTSSSGTVANQYVHFIGTPILAASSTTTYTTAGTLVINAPPTAGTNVTITNPLSLYVSTGKSRLDEPVGFGSVNPLSTVHIGGTQSRISWTTAGTNLASNANTTTDTTGSGTVAIRTGHSFGIPTWNSTSSVTVTDGANVYIAGAAAGTGNTTISSAWALWIDAGNTRIDGLISTGSTIRPQADDGGAIGAATLGYSDLFLASGAVIGFANGNAVITHSSGVLNVTTGDLRVTTAGADAASVVTTAGTQTISNKTQTNPTINAATLTGTIAGTPTYSGAATYTGANNFDNVIQSFRATSITENIRIEKFAADANGSFTTYRKSRNAALGGNTIVQASDVIGGFQFKGANGTGYDDAVLIQGIIDGTPGASNDMPGALQIYTTANGSASLSEAMRIDNAGAVYFPRVGTTVTAANGFLNNGSSPANSLLRSTSRGADKKNIEKLLDAESEKIYDLIPRWYRSKCAGDDPKHSHDGFLAEEVFEINPRWVHMGYPQLGMKKVNRDGKKFIEPVFGEDIVPTGVQYDRMIPAIVQELTKLRKQVRELQGAV